MYKIRGFRGVGCAGNRPCTGCMSIQGLGEDPVPVAHADAAQDRELMEGLFMKYTAITVVSVLAGMYFIEEYWGNYPAKE